MQTAPLIPALRNAGESQRQAIRGGGLAQRESVIAAIGAPGGHDYTLSPAREQRAQAYAALKGLAESTYQTGFAELARLQSRITPQPPPGTQLPPASPPP
jgi:hypothetical protein